MPLPQAQKRYTYQDYITWPDDERWEIIDGVAYNMSPAPTFKHQHVVSKLDRIIGNALEGELCIPIIAPIDVFLSETDIVQPDVLVVCDREKIHDDGVHGAPDLIIEVLSPSTEIKDRREKKVLFETHGVQEYLLVNVERKFVERYFLDESRKYGAGEILTEAEILKLHSLNDLEIALSEIFNFPI